MAEYNGVDVDHPRIVEAIKEMQKKGSSDDHIARVVGVPHEVVQKHKEKK